MNAHHRILLIVVTGIVMVMAMPSAVEAQLYGPGDIVLAIDTDPNSDYPGGEGPGNATDQMSSTKYLNFGEEQTGMIVTPAFGSSTIESLQLTTANDAEERDPASYVLYGTNDPITSGDNSLGDQEDWVEISAGDLNLPADRETPGPIVDFANATAYTSYKIIFPTVKDPDLANSMQVADVQFFTDPGGAGSAVLAGGDFAIAVTDDAKSSESNYPGGEGPANVIDGTCDKYLNFGDTNSGFIIARADNAAVTIRGFKILTANDAPERDPASYELYGTNDPIMSPDNSTGSLEDWTLVAEGDLELPIDRCTQSNFVAVDNATSYTAYRVIFPELAGGAGEMQIGEMTFLDILLGDVNCDGAVDLLDVAPFVDLLTKGGYLDKADINCDGAVDLLDVAPFVDLLSG